MSPTINDLYADVAGSGYVTTSVPGDADVLGIVPETGQPFSGGGSKYGIQSTDGQAIFHVLVIGFCNQLLWYWRMLTCFLFTSMLQQYSGFAFGQVIVWCGQPSLAWQTCHPIIGLNTVKAWRLGGGFKYFLFSPRSLGKLSNLIHSYFSNWVESMLKHVETTNWKRILIFAFCFCWFTPSFSQFQLSCSFCIPFQGMTASIIAGNLMSMALSVSVLGSWWCFTFFSLPEIHRYPPENLRIVHPPKNRTNHFWQGKDLLSNQQLSRVINLGSKFQPSIFQCVVSDIKQTFWYNSHSSTCFMLLFSSPTFVPPHFFNIALLIHIPIISPVHLTHCAYLVYHQFFP